MDGQQSGPKADHSILRHCDSLIEALRTLGQPAWIFDRAGRYVFQNRLDSDTFGDMTGLTPVETGLEPLLGREWLDMHLRVIAGEEVRYDRELETQRGRVASETTISPIVLGENIVGGVGVSVDQTLRVRAETRLCHAHQRLKDYLDISSDWVWDVDVDHRFTEVHGDGEKLGLDFKAWIGKCPWEVTDNTLCTASDWQAYHSRVEAREPVSDFVFPFRRTDGKILWVDVRGRPTFDEQGQFTGYRGVTRDVTVREEMSRQLHRSDIVIRAIDSSVILCDLDGRIEWVNPAFERSTGYSFAEARGRNPADLLEGPRTDRTATEAIGQAIANRQQIRTQLLNRSKSGRHYWVDLNLQPVLGAGGAVEGFVGVQSDVTDLIQARQRTSAIVEYVAAGIVLHDASGEIIGCNPEACRLLELTEEQMLGRALTDPRWGTIYSDGRTRPASELPSSIVLRTREAIRNDTVGVRLPDGRTRWLQVNARIATSDLSDEIEVIASFIDITRDEEQRQELKEARELLQDVIDTIPDAISAYNADDELILFNQSFVGAYQNSAPSISLGARFEDILRFGLEADQYEDTGNTPQDRDAWLKARLENHRNPGQNGKVQKLLNDRWLQIRERRSQTGVIVNVGTDITAVKQAELAIREIAETDNLTKLAVRSVVMREIEAALGRTGEEGAIVIIDLDHFKTVNDTLGHDAGDRLLIAIAERLRAMVSHRNHVARLGGDEFAVLLAGPGVAEEVEDKIQGMHALLSHPVGFDGKRMRPGVSLGVAVYPRDGVTAPDLLKNADIALYQTKAHGRDGWTLFNPDLRDRVERRHALSEALRTGIPRGRVSVALQPIVSIATPGVFSFEALARWTHDGVPVPPLEFVSVAEERGLGVQLGQCVIEGACKHLKTLEGEGAAPGHIAVNVATSQLKDPGFPGWLEKCLARFDLTPSRLELEVTETVLLGQAVERVADTLERLQAMGFTIAMDDFGTGYASLAHLKRFPVSRLKIDKSFVDNVGDEGGDAVIVRSIVDLAHSLGMTVVAEGVENRAQLSFLRDCGCDFVQGYLIGRPTTDIASYCQSPPHLPG
ncbi:bifunctional diguanylate cyclase/phosphodiesterase [Stappia sp. ES.058]|uniref:sensor domain-containing protein n=1 Tax=Stappia sp. ES.058 TaxID=1881061 RepID=UPI00087BBCD5|nr:bifunctional diguanylate cyclase/phosphodiesterase [Stappia sp. ES.058]SDU27850.1 PAS domain S-box-containing protein/diguanylate cyclase (GGDEF) domain-containing protein [Stappia sp. ES.058]